MEFPYLKAKHERGVHLVTNLLRTIALHPAHMKSDRLLGENYGISLVAEA